MDIGEGSGLVMLEVTFACQGLFSGTVVGWFTFSINTIFFKII